MFSKLSPLVYKNKSADYHEKYRVRKYALYFRGNQILPIPELVAAVLPKTLSFIITNLRTRKLTGFKKETLVELLKSADIRCRHFCPRSFAPWDVLLSSEKLAITPMAVTSPQNTSDFNRNIDERDKIR